MLAGSVLAADSASDVKAAAKKLADKGNYSWKSVSESAGGGGFRVESDGKFDAGTTALSWTFGDNTVEAVLKGDKGAVKTDEGWKSLSEAAEAAGDGGQGNPGRFLARRLQTYKAPAAEAEELAGKVKELKKDGDVHSGELTTAAVKELLSRFGRRPGADAPEIADPKGSVKFWTKDGVLSKYEYNLQGKVTFNDNEREVNRTTTIEIKDAGSTKVNVPEEAKKKLS